jgi:F-type H+-transporting ATPase subunit b
MLDLLALGGGGGILDELGINPKVLLVQVAIFVTTFILLSRFLFARVLSFMKQREEEQASAAEKIRHNQAEVERLQKEYEAAIAKVEKEAYARLQESLKEAIEAKNRIVGEAQAKARAEVEAARAVIASEKAQAVDGLRAEVARLAREAAGRILEEPVDEAVVRRIVS